VERGISVISRLFAASLILSLALCWTLVGAAQQVVLVTGENSPIENLSPLELRKAYFGIVVRYDDQIIRPFRNSSDSRLSQIFLQTVVAMSERAYERRLFSLTLKSGRPRPEEFTDQDNIVRALRKYPYGISYMWRSDAERAIGIKVIKLLWQEN
jgi:hypothetical protein